MNFSQIQAILGEKAVSDLQQAVTGVYQQTGGREEDVHALRKLMIVLLGSIITSERFLPMAAAMATEDATDLLALVKHAISIVQQAPVAPKAEAS